MTTINLAINASHPIHHLLDELHVSMFEWLSGIQTAEGGKMLRAISRAMGSVKNASVGRRQAFHLGNAIEALICVETGFRVLFQRRQISPALFDKARRRVYRVLKTVERLTAADDLDWSQVEPAPLEEGPADLAEDPIVKRQRLLIERIAKEARALRTRKSPQDPEPEKPLKDAA
jgi:hypothetical protein